MKRLVPHNVDYTVVKRIDRTSTIFLYVNAGIALTTIILEKALHVQKEYVELLNSILCLVSVLYLILDIFQNHLFQLAELNRRKDFIDNSLSTTLADVNSKGYFSNEYLDHSVYKLGVNCFENTFFSKATSGMMIPERAITCLVIIALFLCVAIFTDQQILTTVFQMALPYTILSQTIKLTIFHFRVRSILETFKTIFSTARKDRRDPLLISNVINYESTLSWGGIMLDSRIFNQNNDRLSVEWNELKAKLDIT